MNRKILILLFSIFVLVSLQSCSARDDSSETVATVDYLELRGRTLFNTRGEEVVLRGCSSHGIGWYPRYLNGEAMKNLKEKGANVQRLAMYTEGEYINNPELSKNYLYMAIESVIAADMYAIVDWHILEDGNPLKHMEEAKSFFTEISEHYANSPHIIDEICNEPNGDTTWSDIKDYARQIIPIIRKNSPRAIIIVGTPDYCSDFTDVISSPLEFANVMYSLHKYIDVSKRENFSSYTLDMLLGNDFPVFVSEWGTAIGEQAHFADVENFTHPDKAYYENAEEFINYMSARGISWTAWSLSNKNEAHSMIKHDVDKYSNWTDEDLTEFGRLIFRNLR